MSRTAPSTTSWRAVGVGLGLATAAAALAWWSGSVVLHGLPDVSGAGSVPVAQGLVLLVAVGAGLVAAGGAVLALLGTLAVLPGRGAAGRVRHRTLRGAPRWAPRAAALLLSLSLASPAAALPVHADVPGVVADAPALHAAPEGDPPPGGGSQADERPGVPLPGWTPAERAPQPSSVAARLVTAGSAPDRAVVVHRGDTLWAIAARHLGPDATAEEIAADWPRWHEVNRAVIGDNPHLILPGQQLLPPPALSEGTRP
jgi:hypothetical protein